MWAEEWRHGQLPRGSRECAPAWCGPSTARQKFPCSSVHGLSASRARLAWQQLWRNEPSGPNERLSDCLEGKAFLHGRDDRMPIGVAESQRGLLGKEGPDELNGFRPRLKGWAQPQRLLQGTGKMGFPGGRGWTPPHTLQPPLQWGASWGDHHILSVWGGARWDGMYQFLQQVLTPCWWRSFKTFLCLKFCPEKCTSC